MTITLIIIGSIVFGLFLQAFMLYLISKISKIPNATFKTSFKIAVLSIICVIGASLVVGFIAALVGITQKYIFYAIGVILGFYIFHLLMKKYYQTQVLKNLLVYLVQTAIGILISLLIVVPIIYIRMNVGEPFVVAGNAMNPNFTNGQYVLLNKTDEDYSRGDVVVHKYPNDPSQFFFKRIIGLPGEKVEIKNGYVYVNDLQLKEDYLPTPGNTYSKPGVVVLKNDEYFVLGDNRTASSDSRVWGPVAKDLIIGKYWKTMSGKTK